MKAAHCRLSTESVKEKLLYTNLIIISSLYAQWFFFLKGSFSNVFIRIHAYSATIIIKCGYA